MRTQHLNTLDIKKCHEYISWVAEHCFGEDINLLEVEFGYVIDDFIDRCIDPLEYMLSKVGGFKVQTTSLNDELWNEIK